MEGLERLGGRRWALPIAGIAFASVMAWQAYRIRYGCSDSIGLRADHNASSAGPTRVEIPQWRSTLVFEEGIPGFEWLGDPRIGFSEA